MCELQNMCELQKTTEQTKTAEQKKTAEHKNTVQQNPKSDVVTRRSGRLKSEKRSFSPDQLSNEGRMKKCRKVVSTANHNSNIRVHPFDRDLDGNPFCCDLCKSPYICHPSRSGRKVRKKGKRAATPRYRIHPDTGHMLTLCNACGLCLGRAHKPKPVKAGLATLKEKQAYLEEARTFADSLSETLSDDTAKVLFCPQFKKKACKCMQNYIIDKGCGDETAKRARQLLSILTEATRLSKQRYDGTEQEEDSTQKRSHPVGLGNGKRKSEAFAQFVLSQRHQLHTEVGLCEMAIQKILHYSNNFLHKILKSLNGKSDVCRVGSKSAKHNLTPISELSSVKCCGDNCVRMSLSHHRLLEEWRQRAANGQSEARRVLAEMLTPSGGARANCYKFIGWVTGCSSSTISKVCDQMRRTGGDREPPEHGLIRLRRLSKMQKIRTPHSVDRTCDDNMTSKVIVQATETVSGTIGGFAMKHIDEMTSSDSESNTPCTLQSTQTSNDEVLVIQLDQAKVQLQREQLLELHEKQLELQQQQKLLEYQLLQQLLLLQFAGVNPSNGSDVSHLVIPPMLGQQVSNTEDSLLLFNESLSSASSLVNRLLATGQLKLTNQSTTTSLQLDADNSSGASTSTPPAVSAIIGTDGNDVLGMHLGTESQPTGVLGTIIDTDSTAVLSTHLGTDSTEVLGTEISTDNTVLLGASTASSELLDTTSTVTDNTAVLATTERTQNALLINE